MLSESISPGVYGLSGGRLPRRFFSSAARREASRSNVSFLLMSYSTNLVGAEGIAPPSHPCHGCILLLN
jgi:hypothetical protein